MSVATRLRECAELWVSVGTASEGAQAQAVLGEDANPWPARPMLSTPRSSS